MQDQDVFNKQLTKVIEMLGKSIDTLGELAEFDDYDGDDLLQAADTLNEVIDMLMSRD